MEFRRFDPAQQRDRRRIIKAYSRYRTTPSEVVIELLHDESGFRYLGDCHAAGVEAQMAKIERVLREIPGLTTKAIRSAWLEEPKPATRTLELWLKKGLGERWTTTGTGKKNDPYRYYVSLGTLQGTASSI
jgi:hypothetical protein